MRSDFTTSNKNKSIWAQENQIPRKQKSLSQHHLGV
jgi:hypothetical protein